MKIVSGQYGGRRLIVPKSNDIRPTSDKVRGAVFNMLDSRAANDEKRVLDAFCGTGALGLEALSRGAKHCTFIDKSRISLDLAKENAKNLDTFEACRFLLKDASKLPENDQEPYDLVFLDPPYDKGLVPKTLETLIREKWLNSSAWIVCETEKRFELPEFEPILLETEKIYGDTKVIVLRYRA